MKFYSLPKNLINHRLDSFQKFFSNLFLKKLFIYFDFIGLLFLLESSSCSNIRIETGPKEEIYSLILTQNLEKLLKPKKIAYFLRGLKEKSAIIPNENHFGSEMIVSFSFNPEICEKTCIFRRVKKVPIFLPYMVNQIREINGFMTPFFLVAISSGIYNKRLWSKIKNQNPKSKKFFLFRIGMKKRKTIERIKEIDTESPGISFFFGKKLPKINNKIPIKFKMFHFFFNTDEKEILLLSKKICSSLRNKIGGAYPGELVEFFFQETPQEIFLGGNSCTLKEVLKNQGFFFLENPYEGNFNENFGLSLSHGGLILKRKVLPGEEVSPFIGIKELENFEIISNLISLGKKSTKNNITWSHSNLFSDRNFGKNYFSVSENTFFLFFKKRSPFLSGSKKNFFLIFKILGQIKLKQFLNSKKKYQKFSGNSLIKNLVKFSNSGKTDSYSGVGKFKN